MPPFLFSIMTNKVSAGIGAMLVIVGTITWMNRGDDNNSDKPDSVVASTETLKGRWNIRYYDRFLGVVRGHAFIDENEAQGRVVLKLPKKEYERYQRYQDIDDKRVSKEYSLFFEDIKRSRNRISFDLVGDWPGSHLGNAQAIGQGFKPYSGNSQGKQAERDFNQAELTIEIDGKQKEITFKSGDEEGEQDIVHIELRQQTDFLSGRWHYRAYGWNAREKDGNGRIYNIAYDKDGNLEAYGFETWQRPEPAVELVVPLNHIVKQKAHPINGGANVRSILIVGHDLPDPRYEKLDMQPIVHAPSDKNFRYKAEKPDAQQLKQAMPALQNQLSEGDFERIENGINSGKLETLLITAEFDNQSRPGLTHFRLNDAVNRIEIAWMLTFDDYFADMQFARKLIDASSLEPLNDPAPERNDNQTEEDHRRAMSEWATRYAQAHQDVYEPTSTLFAPDELYIVFNSKVELPYTDIPLMVGVGDQVLTFNGGQELKAVKDKVMPTRYVAGPFVLPVQDQIEQSEHPFDLDTNTLFADQQISYQDRISVRVHHTHYSLSKRHWLLKTTSPIISAEVTLSPRDNVIDIQGQPRKLFTTWNSAYEVARGCYPELNSNLPRYNTIDDPYTGGVLKVGEYTNYIVNNFFQGKSITRSTALQLGDHAAMLLLRDTYLAMMDRQRLEMTRALENPGGFYDLMRPYSRVGNYKVGDREVPSLMRQQVTLPDGLEVDFFDAFYNYRPAWADDLGWGWGSYLEGLASQALSSQINDIDANIALVREAHRCDKNKLVELTQKYYRAVAPHSFKKLYRQYKADEPFQADKIARAWVRGLYWLSENQATERELNTTDNYMLASETAAIGLIPAAIGTAGSYGAAGVAYLAGTGGAAASGATATLAAETAFSMGGLWSAIIATVETVDVGYSAYLSYNDLSQYQQDLEFARTSQAILGYQQYKVLNDQFNTKYGWAAFDTALSALGVAGSIKAIKHAGNSLESLSNTSKLINKAFVGDAAALYARRGTLVQDTAQWATHSVEQARHTGGLIYQNLRNKAHQFVYPPLVGAKQVVPSATTQRSIVKDIRKLMTHNNIDASNYTDEVLAEMAKRFGTQEFTRAALNDLPTRMAYRRAAYAAMDEITQRGSQTIDRYLSGYELARSTTQERRVLATMVGEIQKLPSAERILFAEWLRQFADHFPEAARQSAILSRPGREAIVVYQHLQEVLNNKFLDEFGKNLSVPVYEKVIDIYHPELRKPLEALIEENPQRFSRLISDDVGQRLLRGNDFETLDQLEQALELEKKRIRTANPAGFKEIGGKPPSGLYLDEAVRTSANGGLEATIDVSSNWLWGRKDKRFANFTRKVNNIENLESELLAQLTELDLPRRGKIFTFASALIQDLDVPPSLIHARDQALQIFVDAYGKQKPRAVLDKARNEYLRALANYDQALERTAVVNSKTMISYMKNPMIPGKGTPLAAYLNQRLMHKLGIEYADSALKVVRLENVVNKKTALQLDWLQKVYAGKNMPIDEMLSFTDSYRYAESALNQAGFKITGAKLSRGTTSQRLIGGVISDFASDNNTHSFGKEGINGFLKRFRGINPLDKVDVGFDIFLTVAPL